MDMLTSEAVVTLYRTPYSRNIQPTLQVIHKKVIDDSSGRCCLVLSDGKHCISSLVDSDQMKVCNEIQTCCVIQILDYSLKFVAGTMIILAHEIKHLSCSSVRFGSQNPIYYELESTSMCSLLQAQLELVTFKENQIRRFQAAVQANARAASEMVTLNVGGQHYQTAVSNLLRHAHTYFTCMLANSPKESEYFIDVDPIHFDRIMAHLRTGDSLSYDGLSLWETLQLRKTARFLGLEQQCTTTDKFIEHMQHLNSIISA